MLDQTTQILLIVVISILTLLLVVIGIQVFLILKEFQQSVKKMNQLLSNAEIISGSIARPFSSLSETIGNLSGVGGFLKLFLKKKDQKEEE